jgi:glutamate racemase
VPGPPSPPPRQRPIGVFDSGVGGLTVLHELLVALPHEDFVYLGDTGRFPYGMREPDELERFALQIAEHLLRLSTMLFFVTDTTAAPPPLPALHARMMETTLGVDVVAVVGPESQLAVEATRNGRIGLLATPATVASGAYHRAVGTADEMVELHAVPCPDLAPIIQGGFPFDQHVVDTVRAYCDPLREAEVDTVILGCTHYPLVAPMLQRTLGRKVRLVSSGPAIARRVEHALEHRGLSNPRADEGDYRFLCTGDVDAFRDLGTRFLQMPLGEVVHLDLEREPAPA